MIDLCKKLLHPSQLDLVELEEPQQDHHGTLSPVVQNLEHVAISDPAYRNGQTRNSQSQAQNQPMNVPLPPALPAHSSSSMSSPSPPQRQPNIQDKQSSPVPFVPMAYNPAAPPAPEPIAHREDTPPLPDDGHGTGLAAAALHDNAYNHVTLPSQPYSGVPGPQPNLYSHTGSPPPAASTYHSPAQVPGYHSPPPTSGFSPQHPQQSHTPFASVPSFAPPPQQFHTSSTTSPFFDPPPAQAAPTDTHRHSSAAEHYVPHPPLPHSQSYTQPLPTPGTQFYNSMDPLAQPHKPLQHVQPQYPDYLTSQAQHAPPPGGFSQYSYDQAQHHHQHLNHTGASNNQYDVHHQVYRPTEGESHAHRHKPSRTSTSSTKPSGLDRLEKGAGKWFKKIEKKIG